MTHLIISRFVLSLCISAMLFLCAGCSVIEYQSGDRTFKRSAFGLSVDVGTLKVHHNPDDGTTTFDMSETKSDATAAFEAVGRIADKLPAGG